jgi:hypothetical protein
VKIKVSTVRTTASIEDRYNCEVFLVLESTAVSEHPTIIITSGTNAIPETTLSGVNKEL